MLYISRFRFIFLVPLLTLSGCATNPVTGNPDFVTITEQQEISIGATYHQRILEEQKILEDKELNDYVQKWFYSWRNDVGYSKN